MRLHIILAILTGLLLYLTIHSSRKHRFSFANVQQLAQERAAAKYVPLPNALPPQLRNLTPQQEAGIFWKDTYRLWRKKGLPFQVDFYHIGKKFPSGPQINSVDRKGAHLLAYSPTFFNFLNLTFGRPLPSTLPYAGFYLRYPINKPDSLDGFFSVLGGCYFRVLAKDQVYGLSARGLAIDSRTDGKSEEFPQFTDWWLHEPAPNDTHLVVDALLDSPSVTGAYEFTIRPGAATAVDVQATLFFRRDVDELGLAPFSSMYLYGESSRDHLGDSAHPEIHDSDGILMNTGQGEWVWRPLQQRPDRQVYEMFDENPKGFGLVQRDRNFKNYQDLALNYNVRPSAWVTPHGNWGKGDVQLIQANSRDVTTDNVTAFWHPEARIKAGSRLDIGYLIDFYMNDAQRPPLAYCEATYINDPAPPPPPPPPAPPAPAGAKPGAPSAPVATNAAPVAAPAPPPVPAPPTGVTPVQFLIDFVGNGIENIPANQPPDIDLTYLPAGTYLRDKKVEKNGYDNSWRVTFTIIPAKPHVPTELRCHLTRGGKPLTETWSYTWHQ